MRPPYFYPPTYTMNAFQMPYAGFSPFAMRPPIPMQAPFPMQPQIPVQPQIPLQAATGAMPRIDSFLANANSLFNNAQKFTPYFQQAAPMFKNLPALWKIYKGFKDTPADSDFELESTAPQATGPAQPQPQSQVPLTPRPSVPRIYQPPFDF
ncbi:VrrA/YqfQ family protein [Solibacillus sp. FSL H8-0538]|uniref:VrrA/YqfQ family protein n=1 Tax=Solibacillus sp. FSL H8-0538 TaxID=2921400 RepID=UPI0030F8FEB5